MVLTIVGPNVYDIYVLCIYIIIYIHYSKYKIIRVCIYIYMYWITSRIGDLRPHAGDFSIMIRQEQVAAEQYQPPIMTDGD